ncbi:MAG TPA: YcjX family protein [Hyphomicrobiaceae bacterium]|nr:YcjX family protein [Hyphomicrobiaceae bacterium]
MHLSDLADGTLDTIKTAGSYLSRLATPIVRLGVTGFAQSGKTVFITALARTLMRGGRLPFFDAYANGRVLRAYLEPQPDDSVPRFDYERHLAALERDPPEWPESTRRLSQLRVTVEYQPTGRLRRAMGRGRLHIDIVDYPGEWLIDLALLEQSYEDWSRQAVAQAYNPVRAKAAGPWLATLAALDPAAPQDEQKALEAAKVFTAYLRAAREAEPALSTVGPGRFLMPGDLEGSPLLTFVPLVTPDGWTPPHGTLSAMMARRFASYKSHVVKPFFRDHFSRLDRQIVLVDALAAVNAGAAAVGELTRALEASLRAFRPGAKSWLAPLLGRRVDRILYAAAKTDHLPQSSHDRLEAILRLMTERAAARASFAGAEVRVLALAALRATSEVEAQHGSECLPCIRGVPMAGERLGTRLFDGRTEVAIFPGDLPADLRSMLERSESAADNWNVRFVRFRPPRLANSRGNGELHPWPHIRLDRALDYLIGDRLA